MRLFNLVFIAVTLTVIVPTASAELSAFEQTLQNNLPIETRESVEVHNGVRYRKVESGDGTFYFKFLGRSEEVAELHCNGESFTANLPTLVEGSVQVFRRSRIFIRGLKEICEDKHGQRRYKIDPSPGNLQLGVRLPDGKGDKLKDKEVFINPLKPGLNGGFSGSF